MHNSCWFQKTKGYKYFQIATSAYFCFVEPKKLTNQNLKKIILVEVTPGLHMFAFAQWPLSTESCQELFTLVRSKTNLHLEVRCTYPCEDKVSILLTKSLITIKFWHFIV